jgi:hypothetical protein
MRTASRRARLPSEQREVVMRHLVVMARARRSDAGENDAQ